jgi:Flp pilus assembly protein TadG
MGSFILPRRCVVLIGPRIIGWFHAGAMHSRQHIRVTLRGCAATDEGSAIVEFSLTMPVVVVFCLAAISFALVVQQDIALTDAVAAGTKYGANGHGNDLAGMKSTATTAGSGISGLVVTATKYCSCSPGGAVVTCTMTCYPFPITPAQYVSVTATAPAPLLFAITGLPSSLPLSASSTLRAPW